MAEALALPFFQRVLLAGLLASVACGVVGTWVVAKRITSLSGGLAHAAFGGYKKSGVGRETHKMMLDHYQQTKNMLVSYDTSPLGFF